MFSWMTWPSKEVRDAGLAAAMQDPRMKPYENQTRFDGKRMIFGGFRVLVNAVDCSQRPGCLRCGSA